MTAQTFTFVPVGLVDASPDQNRDHFGERELAELADSIRELGLLQPITVHSAVDRYVLVAGERRLRAVKLLGWAEVPAIVTADDAGADNALRTLAENMVRVDPGPLEEARGLARTAERHGLEPCELARRLGKNPRWVRDRLALLALAADVAHYVQTGQLPIGRGVLMAGLDANRQRLALAAHEHGIGPDAFTGLVATLLTEQSEESMFDADSFLRLEEYVMEAENEAEAVADSRVIRERPVGIAEIAGLLEVKIQTVRVWQNRKVLPEPDFRLSGNPGWWESTILAWAAATGRR